MSEFEDLKMEIIKLRQDMFFPKITAFDITGYVPKRYAMLLLDCTYGTLYNIEKSGKLNVSKIGKKKYYSIESIKTLLKNGDLQNKAY